MCAVSVEGVIKEFLRRGVPMEAARNRLDALHLDIRAHWHQNAIAAACLYRVTRQSGSGLGDHHERGSGDHPWNRIIVPVVQGLSQARLCTKS